MKTFSQGGSLINVTGLGKYVKRKRLSKKLSLRDAAKQTGVSASTLNRMENGAGVPDTQTLARLAEWLDIPLERVMTGINSKKAPKESTLDLILAHLRADPNLTPEQAQDLGDLFRIAYNLRLPKRP